MKLIWHGKEVTEKIGDALEDKLKAIGVLGERDVKRSLSKGQPPSRPGEPPHVLFGELRRKTGHELVRGVNPSVRVGTNAPHGIFQELGTSKMAPRPFLRPWLDGALADIKRILGQRID